MTRFVSHEQVSIDVSGLTSANVIGDVTKIDGARKQGVRIKQIKYAARWQQFTTLEGGVQIGLSVGDGLTDAEVEEALEADPQSDSDQPAQERSERKVFPLFMVPDSTQLDSDQQMEFRAIDRWPFKELNENEALKTYAYNTSGSTLTSGLVKLDLVITGEWLRD